MPYAFAEYVERPLLSSAALQCNVIVHTIVAIIMRDSNLLHVFETGLDLCKNEKQNK